MINFANILERLYEIVDNSLLEKNISPDYCLIGVMDIAVPPLEVMFVQGELTHELNALCEANRHLKFDMVYKEK